MHTAKKNWLDFGAESYIYMIDENHIAKIFRTKKEEVLENKLQKIIKINELGIDFLTNPNATISYDHKFVGYTMEYDKRDIQWFNTFLTFEEKVEYLKRAKEKLLILEEYGILYPDIKDDNLLINKETGMLKFCDVDNVQIGELRVDTTQKISRYLQESDSLFDNSIHAFMHNLYTMEQLDTTYIYTMSDLVELAENPRQGLSVFNRNREQILENMALVRKKDIAGRYLIDNLK